MLSFFVQDRWPGSNQHIFCLRENRIAKDVVVEGEGAQRRARAVRPSGRDNRPQTPAVLVRSAERRDLMDRTEDERAEEMARRRKLFSRERICSPCS